MVLYFFFSVYCCTGKEVFDDFYGYVLRAVVISWLMKMYVLCSVYDLFISDSERYSLCVTSKFYLLTELTVNYGDWFLDLETSFFLSL